MLRKGFELRFWEKKFKQAPNHPVADDGLHQSDEDLLLDYYSKCSWPSTYYSNLTNLARLTQASRILEVGVAYGYHADYILENVPESTYIGVDPYLANYDEKDAFSRDVSNIFQDDPQASMDRLYLAVRNRLSRKYSERFRLIRKYSMDALEEFQAETFDLIFIDGDHRYETVARELPQYWLKLANGGILAGDDYEWPGVALAVDEFAKKNGLETIFLSNTSRGYPTYFFHKRDKGH